MRKLTAQKLTVLFIALLAPLSLAAEGCQHEQNASSCAQGYIWNAETEACEKQLLG